MAIRQSGLKLTPREAAKWLLRDALDKAAGGYWVQDYSNFDEGMTEREQALVCEQVTKMVDSLLSRGILKEKV